ncbi:hypothetical protein SAMN05216227_10763 [Pseudorhodobacter antarcticus]|uniref:Uncharacterized protein n=1 Tax=Pseudorhodobacter antarcticus TaxID=1077947 RepID=A0A1H8NAI3_9RHOB|nr:hypothetical protein SAMN05216227_10763 [Pseudorhodobacter antarcticus]
MTQVKTETLYAFVCTDRLPVAINLWFKMLHDERFPLT